MSIIKRFEDIEAWQLGREIYKEIFQLTCQGELQRDFGLKDQIRRSSGSIMDNIAEGFERDGNKEFRQFLSIAKGSAAEVKSQLYRMLDSNYITKDKFTDLYYKVDKISAKLTNLIKYLNSSNKKGVKYSTKNSEH